MRQLWEQPALLRTMAMARMALWPTPSGGWMALNVGTTVRAPLPAGRRPHAETEPGRGRQASAPCWSGVKLAGRPAAGKKDARLRLAELRQRVAARASTGLG